MNVHTRWEGAENDERCVSWAREFFDASGAFATGGVYLNFVSEAEDAARVSGCMDSCPARPGEKALACSESRHCW